ncbi:MAG TPA: hypothetical protein GXX40_03715 [Firmicutes bacterium]|nr:hypothetical protein [Bacillota bacterium]
MKRPRVRTRDGREVHLETYEAFRDAKLQTQAAMERMLHGLSWQAIQVRARTRVRRHKPLWHLKEHHQHRFIQATRKVLAELMSKPIGGLNLVALFIDGIAVAGHSIVAAMGLDMGGQKNILGLWEGATENSVVCKSLL